MRQQLASPKLQVTAKSCMYQLANVLSDHLKKHTKVSLEASGTKVAEKSLRILALACADLQKATGYLPGFGLLGLRMDRFKASAVDSPCILRGEIARLLQPPLMSEDIVQVVKKKSCTDSLTEDILQHLNEGSGEDFASSFRFVGDAAAERMFLAVQQAQLKAQEEHPSASTMALCPSLGATLSGSGFRHAEVLVLLCPWTNIASETPGVPPIRPRHSHDFIERNEM